jgi:amino acid transporter
MMISLALILLGTMAISGLNAMIDYTSPVFWFFFLMAGIALPVLRRKDPSAVRVFRTPLYPAVPGFFILSSVFMFLSSLLYTRSGALIGVLVLAIGVPVYFLARQWAAR